MRVLYKENILGLLSEIYKEEIIKIITDKDILYEDYNLDEDEIEDYFIARLKVGYIKINKYKLSSIGKTWAMRKGYEVSATRPIVSDEEGYQVFHYYWNAYVYIFEGNLREAPRPILQQYLGIEELEAILEALLWIYQEERK